MSYLVRCNVHTRNIKGLSVYQIKHFNCQVFNLLNFLNSVINIVIRYTVLLKLLRRSNLLLPG